MASAGGSPPPPGATGHCALVTLVSSDSTEASADVYIAKSEPIPGPPRDPGLDDLRPYLEEVVAHAISYTSTASSGSADVQVALIFPANDDAQTDGYRVSLVVDLAYCQPV